jgi:hypothetical protein
MKFVYDGKYTQFMGRVFAFGHPVDVTDKATIMALEKKPEFRKVADEKEIKETTQAVLSDECPKCGKTVKRGKFMHQKHCQGK